MEQRMEHDEIVTMMMEALDGDLGASEHSEMLEHLEVCPSCTREWETLQAIHQLLLQSPVLSPAADFAQRTLALLPNTRYRRYTVSAVYGMLLLIGVVPLGIIVWLAFQFGPALNQPAFVKSMLRGGEQVVSLVQTLAGAGLQGLGTLGELLSQQPSILGWTMVMIGIVFLWGGVYSQLTRQQRI